MSLKVYAALLLLLIVTTLSGLLALVGNAVITPLLLPTWLAVGVSLLVALLLISR